MSEAKVVRYIVAPHQNRGGGISHRCWDIRKIVLDDSGIEHDGGKVDTKKTRQEAENFARAGNAGLKRWNKEEPDLPVQRRLPL